MTREGCDLGLPMDASTNSDEVWQSLLEGLKCEIEGLTLGTCILLGIAAFVRAAGGHDELVA